MQKLRSLDSLTRALPKELVRDGRASHVELAERIGSSATAVARRQRSLEEEGITAEDFPVLVTAGNGPAQEQGSPIALIGAGRARPAASGEVILGALSRQPRSWTQIHRWRSSGIPAGSARGWMLSARNACIPAPSRLPIPCQARPIFQICGIRLQPAHNLRRACARSMCLRPHSKQ